MQTAVEKMICPRHNGDRQIVRFRPSQYIGQWHGGIGRTMNDDGVVRHRFGIVLTQTFDETRRGPDQHQTLRWPAGIGQPPGHARLAIGTEGKTGQHDGNVATPQLCVMQYGQ